METHKMYQGRLLSCFTYLFALRKQNKQENKLFEVILTSFGYET